MRPAQPNEVATPRLDLDRRRSRTLSSGAAHSLLSSWFLVAPRLPCGVGFLDFHVVFHGSLRPLCDEHTRTRYHFAYVVQSDSFSRRFGESRAIRKLLQGGGSPTRSRRRGEAAERRTEVSPLPFPLAAHTTCCHVNTKEQGKENGGRTRGRGREREGQQSGGDKEARTASERK